MIRFTINQGAFNRQLTSLMRQTQRPDLLLAGMGREATNLLRKHFIGKDKTDVNKLAPDRRQHYWFGVSRCVQAPVQTGFNQVSVSINHPSIAQKVVGGTIKAKRVRNLTIPVSPDAYGRTASTFEKETGLKLILLKEGTSLMLVTSRGLNRLQVEYVLTPRVNQKADPTALPEETGFRAALIKRGQAIVDRQAKEGK